MTPGIHESFEPVLHQPCWGVRNTLGSFLILHFGEPSLKVHGAAPNPRTGRLRRLVSTRGEHCLWIQQAAWLIVRDGVDLAHSESPPDLVDAVLRDELAGQALEELAQEDGCFDFRFDLGTVLRTWPLPGDEGPDAEGEWPVMWSLYHEPDHVLTFFGNGGTHVGRGDDARAGAPSNALSGVRPVPG